MNMKYIRAKKININFIAVMAVIALSMAACRHDPQDGGGDFDYWGIGDDYSITRYRGKGGNITIPETIDGHTISGIADRVFANNAGIKSVTIAKSITYIGNNAFNNCANLVSVSIEHTGSYVTISSRTFDNCPNLTSVTCKGTASLMENSFLGDLYDLRDDGSNLLQPGTYTTTAPVSGASKWKKTP